jgi:uncharacterized repeat protein (TIGR01451 family)
VTTLTPELSVAPSFDADGDPLFYEFALARQGAPESTAADVSDSPSWTATPVLSDNTGYVWKARAVDALGAASGWTPETRFFVRDDGVDDAPAVSLAEPAADLEASGGKVLLRWEDGDRDSNAAVSLFYDTAGTGANGTLIAAGIPEDPDGLADTYEWDMAGLAAGTYHVYATIEDGRGMVTSYAPGAVTVPSVNRAPAAHAGSSQVAAERAFVTLDGSASADPDGDPLEYRWTQVEGPPVALDFSDPVRPTFSAPEVGTAGAVLAFELVVRDAAAESAPARASVIVENVRAADLSVTLTDSPDPAAAGATLTYLVTASNAGPDPATGVTLLHALPPGGALLSVTPSRGSCTTRPDAVSCSLGALPVGAGASVKVAVRTPVTPGMLASSASVAGAETDPVFSNNSAAAATTVAGQPRISVAVAAKGPSGAAPGYYVDLKLTNTGSGEAVNVQLSTVTLKTLAGTETAGYASPALPKAIGSLPSGASATVRLYLAVPATVTRFSLTENGTMRNTIGTALGFSSTQSVAVTW